MTSKKPDLEAELKALKAQVRELAQAQATPETSASQGEEEEATESKGPLSLDFDELVDLLKREIDDLPPMTCLAIFGLGVLTGRLLA